MPYKLLVLSIAFSKFFVAFIFIKSKEIFVKKVSSKFLRISIHMQAACRLSMSTQRSLESGYHKI